MSAVGIRPLNPVRHFQPGDASLSEYLESWHRKEPRGIAPRRPMISANTDLGQSAIRKLEGNTLEIGTIRLLRLRKHNG